MVQNHDVMPSQVAYGSLPNTGSLFAKIETTSSSRKRVGFTAG